MLARIQEEHVLIDEVTHFVANDRGYFAYTQGGLSLTILRAHSLQPPIVDGNCYDTWLWLECQEGFYLLRQQIVENEPTAWHVVRRIVPRESMHFFQEFVDVLEPYVEAVGAAG